mgnify:CR=1 FL=1
MTRLTLQPLPLRHCKANSAAIYILSQQVSLLVRGSVREYANQTVIGSVSRTEIDSECVSQSVTHLVTCIILSLQQTVRL